MLTDQQKALIARAREIHRDFVIQVDYDCLNQTVAKCDMTMTQELVNETLPNLIAALEASDQPPQCDGFQYPLGDGRKKCNICGTITAHFGRHDKGDKSQPPQLSESDAELIAKVREGRYIHMSQDGYNDHRLKHDLALRVEQLTADKSKNDAVECPSCVKAGVRGIYCAPGYHVCSDCRAFR